MKHHIIVKFNEGTDVDALLEPVRRIFEQTLCIPGVHGLELKRNCVDRPNRYDLMIVLDMDPEALPAYDVSEPHHQWKNEYGSITARKAIFDCE
ncbi:MAG: hypothetical protein IKQ54_01790 [Oscillospiraceae bacterium]|nr:hypothetical protein [Oscillospiraceae bacterium]